MLLANGWCQGKRGSASHHPCCRIYAQELGYASISVVLTRRLLTKPVILQTARVMGYTLISVVLTRGLPASFKLHGCRVVTVPDECPPVHHPISPALYATAGEHPALPRLVSRNMGVVHNPVCVTRLCSSCHPPLTRKHFALWI